MSNNSILEQIKNNLEWLDINTSGKTWQNIIDELKQRIKGKASPSLPLETLMLIKLYRNNIQYIVKEEKDGIKC